MINGSIILWGRSPARRLRKPPFAEAVEIPLEADPELFRREGRFQIDRDADRAFRKGIDDGKAHQQRDRAADPEVCKEHLPHPALDDGTFLPPLPQPPAGLLRGSQRGVNRPRRTAEGREPDVPEADPLHRLRPFDLDYDQRNKGGPELRHGVADGGRHPIAVAGRTGRRHRGAAGRQDDGNGGKEPLLRKYALDAAVADGDPFHRNRGPKLHAVIRKITAERLHDVRRIVGERKDPPAALDLRLQAVKIQKGEEVVPEESVKGAVQEPAVRTIHRKKIFEVARVRQIAAAFPADEDLLPRTVRLFQQQDFCTPFRGPPRGHHPAGAGADDDHAAVLPSRLRNSGGG